jgi:hypothetical protein
MLTYFEHIGIVSVFEQEMAETRRFKEDYEKNAKLKDQNPEYIESQRQRASLMEERLRALRWSLEKVHKIKHEYS